MIKTYPFLIIIVKFLLLYYRLLNICMHIKKWITKDVHLWSGDEIIFIHATNTYEIEFHEFFFSALSLPLSLTLTNFHIIITLHIRLNTVTTKPALRGIFFVLR